MLRNYFKIAYRNLVKNKTYSLINIMGLAIGLTCSLLILLWVQNEQSFDKFHKDYKSIYRVLQHIRFDNEVDWAITQHPLAKSLKTEVPEIAHATAVVYGNWRIQDGEDRYRNRGIFVDSSFFKIFNFPLIDGNPESVFSKIQTVVITESMAQNRFGSENPIGKTLRVYDQYDVEVTGIMADPPFNSHLQFDFVSPMLFAKEIGYSVDSWGNSGFYTYVKLPESSSAELVNEKIYDFLVEKPTLEDWAKLYLQPIADIHLGSGIDYDNGAGGNRQYVTIFLASALFILVIACVNFMNLATARATKRAKEVGLRKAIGAVKRQLIFQFLVEAVILSLISFFVAIVFVSLTLPSFNEFTGKELSIDYFNLEFLVGALVFGILIGFVAGSYPAFFLSSYQPVKVLKGNLDNGSKGVNLRKVLVVFQCCISIILVIGTLAVYSQVSYMQHAGVGFDKENLVYIRANSDLRNSYESFKGELLSNPNIEKVGGSANFPSDGYSFSNALWTWPGKNPEKDVLFRAEFVDQDYIETFKVELVEGRNFSKELASDSAAVILNEAAIRAMGLDDPVNKTLSLREDNLKIIGIVKDYNFRTLYSAIEPLILLNDPGRANFIWIRVRQQDISGTLAFIEEKHTEFAPDITFDYNFLDTVLANQYQSEQRIGTILQFFSGFAIIVLCLGIFGLVGFSVLQRSKEISMRKVLGAKTGSILKLFMGDYSKLLLISILIAVPTAFYALNKWLNSFPYKMEISSFIFLIPTIGLILLCYSVIIWQSFKATRLNAAENLRGE